MLDFSYYNMDCMDGMKEFPDKYFDLAIVDPPYGGACDENVWRTTRGGRFGGRFDKYREPETDGNITSNIKADRTGGTWASKYGKNIEHWDVAPDKTYFDELFRVSKNQIIWGGNYFNLPPTRCFIVWDKKNISENFSMAMCEYAWTSFVNENAKIFAHTPQGTANAQRIHPCEKPIALYEWLLSRYAKDGDIILDTHVGSANSLIACHRTNHKFVGFELDKEYYEKSKARLDVEMSQMTLFDFMEG